MILLINPAPPANSPWYIGKKVPPLGLTYVAGALEKAGFQVEIVDNYLLEKPIDFIRQTLSKNHPEIVGITCNSVTSQLAVEIAKLVKEMLPSCKIVTGGPHPSFLPESTLSHPEIDYAIMGEGERAIVELATNIMKGKDRENDSIPGVAFLHEGKLVKNAPRFIDNLDEIPHPARHLLPMHLYDRTIEYLTVSPVDTMNIVRGCPFNCAFCDTRKLWGEACRAFSPSRVIEEIENLVNEHGSRGIYFIGDNFTIRKKATLEICKLIKEHKLDIEWACDTRVDMISQELLKEMKDAGCRTIWFGVESGSPKILRKINKDVTLQHVVEAFQLCRKEGIQTACSFMLGIPGETAQDMETTLKFAKKLDPDWCRFNIFIAVPGNNLYNEVLNGDLYDRIEDFVAYVKTEEFNFQSMLEVQRRFHISFNRSPRRILRKIRREGFLSVLKKGLNFSARTLKSKND